MPLALPDRPETPLEQAVLGKALLRTADALSLSARNLAHVLGLSEASISRLRSGSLHLQRGQKSFELALLLIRLYRSLDAISGGDDHVSRAWLRNENAALDARPLDKIVSITGLIDVLSYLDARRAHL